jgi:hypothetical protein
MLKPKADAPLPLNGGGSIVFGIDLVKRANIIPSPLTGRVGVGVHNALTAVALIPPSRPSPAKGGR